MEGKFCHSISLPTKVVLVPKMGNSSTLKFICDSYCDSDKKTLKTYYISKTNKDTALLFGMCIATI